LAQSVTINTTAVDALGYTITGALATPAPITVTGPVTLSAASVTTASSSVTATYPQGSTAAGTVGSTLPLTSGAIAVQPDYGVFASGPSISVIDALDRTLSVVGPGAASGAIAATSCNGGAIAVSPASGSLKIVTLAPSTAAQPVPAAALTSLAVSGLTASSPVAFDASCNAYTAVTLGAPPVTSYSIQKISGFGGTVSASTLATLSAVNGTTGTQGVTLSVAGRTLYAGEYAGAVASLTYTVALPGGATAILDSNAGESVAVSGTTVYKLWDTAGFGPSCPICRTRLAGSSGFARPAELNRNPNSGCSASRCGERRNVVRAADRHVLSGGATDRRRNVDVFRSAGRDRVCALARSREYLRLRSSFFAYADIILYASDTRQRANPAGGCTHLYSNGCCRSAVRQRLRGPAADHR
jgi:hypothetical protein